MPSEAVIVRFKYGKSDKDPLYELEEKIAEAVEDSGAGEYDGHELAMDDSEGYLLLFGPDARAIFDAIEPELAKVRFMRGCQVELCFGDHQDEETEREIFTYGK